MKKQEEKLGGENTGANCEEVTVESVINRAESEKGEREDGCRGHFVIEPGMDN